MAQPAEKLAQSLEILHSFQEKGIVTIKSNELTRVHRERLIQNGFLQEVMRGWYLISRPDQKTGDTASWYASYWDFCARFLEERYGDQWVISAEQSLLLQADNWTVPGQLLLRSPIATNHGVDLPNSTSLFAIKRPLPSSDVLEIKKGIRLYSLPAALVYCSANTFIQNAVDARAALASIRDASPISRVLLTGGHSTYAGRLVGAFRNIGNDRIADEILFTLKAAGYDVREADPFTTPSTINLPRERSPYANRIRLLWKEMREVVIRNFPSAPGISSNHSRYLKEVDDVYVTDAYHSLSIERYRVSADLIERVRSGKWDLGKIEDQQQRDAMAARGYWQTFLQVKESLKKILEGDNAGQVVEHDHGRWYVELFSPSVTAGIIGARDLAGYRNAQVYIGGSKHVPVNVDAVGDVMPVLFELLNQETEASVRSVLGHFIFVYIHPYMDGNGRMGRFLMNTMLASGGYPWTVIPVEERENYMRALESASVEQNIEPFAVFLGRLVTKTMKGQPVASLK